MAPVRTDGPIYINIRQPEQYLNGCMRSGLLGSEQNQARHRFFSSDAYIMFVRDGCGTVGKKMRELLPERIKRELDE